MLSAYCTYQTRTILNKVQGEIYSRMKFTTTLFVSRKPKNKEELPRSIPPTKGKKGRIDRNAHNQQQIARDQVQKWRKVIEVCGPGTVR